MTNANDMMDLMNLISKFPKKGGVKHEKDGSYSLKVGGMKSINRKTFEESKLYLNNLMASKNSAKEKMNEPRREESFVNEESSEREVY